MLMSALSDVNKNLVREIFIIVSIKIIILMVIKSIWFSAPTIPVDQDKDVATHIVGN